MMSGSSLPRSVRVNFAANIFLACASFAIVMPSIWPYIQHMQGTQAFLAWAVAAYSVGEAAGAFGSGWLYGRCAPRPLLIGSVIMSGVGAGLYALASALPFPLNLALVCTARFVQGMGSGAEQAVEQAVVAECVEPAQRTQATSELSSWAMLGFLIGPVCGLPLSLLGGHLGPFVLDPNTYPGLFICCCNLVMLAVTWTCFRPGPRLIRSLGQKLLSSHNSFDVHQQPLSIITATDLSSTERSSLAVCMIIFLVHFCGFAAIETICTPMIATEFHWSVTTSFALFTAAAVLSLIAMVWLGSVEARVPDCHLILATLLTAAFGFALMMFDLQRHAGPLRYVTGFVLISLAFPVGRAVTLSMMSKIAEKSANQGLYLGAAFAVGAVARIVGPFVAVCVPPTILFRTCALIFSVTIALQFHTWNSLVQVAADPSPAVYGVKRRLPLYLPPSSTCSARAPY